MLTTPRNLITALISGRSFSELPKPGFSGPSLSGTDDLDHDGERARKSPVFCISTITASHSAADENLG
jgi:hypothetical protein